MEKIIRHSCLRKALNKLFDDRRRRRCVVYEKMCRLKAEKWKIKRLLFKGLLEGEEFNDFFKNFLNHSIFIFCCCCCGHKNPQE